MDEYSSFAIGCVLNQTYQACISKSWFMSCYAEWDLVDLMCESRSCFLSYRKNSSDAMSQQPHKHQGSVFMFSYFTTAVNCNFDGESVFPAVLSLEVTATANVYEIPWVLLPSFELVAVSLVLYPSQVCVVILKAEILGWEVTCVNCCFFFLFKLNRNACFDCLFRTFCARMGYHSYRQLFLQGFQLC